MYIILSAMQVTSESTSYIDDKNELFTPENKPLSYHTTYKIDGVDSKYPYKILTNDDFFAKTGIDFKYYGNQLDNISCIIYKSEAPDDYIVVFYYICTTPINEYNEYKILPLKYNLKKKILQENGHDLYTLFPKTFWEDFDTFINSEPINELNQKNPYRKIFNALYERINKCEHKNELQKIVHKYLDKGANDKPITPKWQEWLANIVIAIFVLIDINFINKKTI